MFLSQTVINQNGLGVENVICGATVKNRRLNIQIPLSTRLKKFSQSINKSLNICDKQESERFISIQGDRKKVFGQDVKTPNEISQTCRLFVCRVILTHKVQYKELCMANRDVHYRDSVEFLY